MNEKQQFAERLRNAMIGAGYEPRSNVLEANFNSRYWGRSVTYQAARRWLIGLSIPEQEKLQVIADWLGVEPHVLRYGQGSSKSRVGESRATWNAAVVSQTDYKAINMFLVLPAERRKLVRELIATLTSPQESPKTLRANERERQGIRPRRK